MTSKTLLITKSILKTHPGVLALILVSLTFKIEVGGYSRYPVKVTKNKISQRGRQWKEMERFFSSILLTFSFSFSGVNIQGILFDMISVSF